MKKSWIVTVECKVLKEIVTIECTEAEAQDDPFGNALDVEEKEMSDYTVVDVEEAE